MTQVAIGLYGLHSWFGGDFAPVSELVRTAEKHGVDLVSLTDHVVMGENLQNYPYGRFPAPLDYPWFEPSRWTSYSVSLPGRATIRCNPVNAPKGCVVGAETAP